MLSSLIGKLLKKNPQQGFALLKQDGKKDDGDWIVPHELFAALPRLNEEDLMSALRSLVSTNRWTEGWQVEVTVGYDFRRVLDRLSDLQKSLKHQERLAIMPMNLLSEWAKQDPISAWEWAQQHEDLPFCGPADFCKGYRSIVSTEEFARFVAEATSAKGDSGEDRFGQAWKILAGDPNTDVLSVFLEKLPGDKMQNLRDFFGAAASGASGGDYDRFKEILLRQMTASERVYVLSNYFKDGGNLLESKRAFYGPLLGRLGHSEEEIQRMLSPQSQAVNRR